MTLFARKPTTRSQATATVRRQPPPADLGPLLDRISRGSRSAFVTLYDGTSDVLRNELEARLLDADWAATVLTSTYVEVWWMASCHTGPDPEVRAWINTIVERRVFEGSPDAFRSTEATPVAVDLRSRCATLELARLLGRPVAQLDSR